jgi:hypothetical protein
VWRRSPTILSERGSGDRCFRSGNARRPLSRVLNDPTGTVESFVLAASEDEQAALVDATVTEELHRERYHD